MTTPDRELRRIGLLGGMSWESTAVYYRLLNQAVHERVGGHASAPITLWSADFAQIERLQRAGDWAEQGRILRDAAAALEASGVDAVALATNTLHVVANDITSKLTVPFVGIVDVVGHALVDRNLRRVGMLGTEYLMASDLYPRQLREAYGVDVMIPDEADRATVHRIIYDELVHGVVRDASRAAYLDVIDRLAQRDAQAVVLACTEIDLLVQDGDASVPLLDTTVLHCAALTEVIVAEASTA